MLCEIEISSKLTMILRSLCVLQGVCRFIQEGPTSYECNVMLRALLPQWTESVSRPYAHCDDRATISRLCAMSATPSVLLLWCL